MVEFLAGSLLTATILLQVGITLLNIIGLYRVFQKMGMPGWKGLIPLYNTFKLYSTLWDSKLFWVGLVAALCINLPVNEESPIFLSLLVLVMAVVSIVLTLKLYIRLAHAFGKGTFFGVLTCFFSPICLAILGFGGAEYQGRAD